MSEGERAAGLWKLYSATKWSEGVEVVRGKYCIHTGLGHYCTLHYSTNFVSLVTLSAPTGNTVEKITDLFHAFRVIVQQQPHVSSLRLGSDASTTSDFVIAHVGVGYCIFIVLCVFLVPGQPSVP